MILKCPIFLVFSLTFFSHLTHLAGCHAAFLRHIQKRAEEPRPAVPAPPGRAVHRGRAVEPHAQHLPQRGDGPRQREARLGGPVPGAAGDDGGAHTRRKQVNENCIFGPVFAVFFIKLIAMRLNTRNKAQIIKLKLIALIYLRMYSRKNIRIALHNTDIKRKNNRLLNIQIKMQSFTHSQI